MYTQSQVDDLFAALSFYTKTESDSRYFTQTHITTLLQDYYTKAQADARFETLQGGDITPSSIGTDFIFYNHSGTSDPTNIRPNQIAYNPRW